jgi:hypothetical protein
MTSGICEVAAQQTGEPMASALDDDKSAPEYSQKWWTARIDEVEKELDKKWRDFADKIVNRYLDVRDDENSVAENSKRYNIFWANVQIMKSALYATPPSPSVTRQSSDAKDDVARTAAMMLERMLDIGVNKDASDMNAAFKYGVEDRLIPGMGQVWLRYDVEIEDYTTPSTIDPYTGAVIPGQAAQRIIEEEAPCDYVHWRDFLWSPARTWEEVWWVSRRCWMKKKAFIKRFGQKAYDEVKDNYETERKVGKVSSLPKGFAKGRVEVFEVWCEDTNKVYFVNRHTQALLDTQDDPLGLDDFFPCPKPLIATHTTNSIIPRADYTMVQDQYNELDVLNDRISVLTQALRVVGVYDKNQNELAKMLTGGEFNMIAVDNWAMLAEKGGLKGSVDWFPVEQIANVLEKLMVQRQAVIGQIYELTSISDIMRGASSSRETAKAQTLKAQYSSVRLQLTQKDVARWVMHAMKIKAEIICRHFQPKSIMEQSQVDQTDSAQFAQAAVELLKSYEGSEYRIEVGEDTLSLADYNAEREMRTEYITAVGQFLSQASSIMGEAPEALPYLLRMVQWVTASFRGSSDIESVLDEAIKMASQPKPQQPDPKAAADQAKAQADGQIAQVKAQADLQKTQLLEQGRQQSDQLKVQLAQMQIDSAERIATQNNETKMLVEQLKAELTKMVTDAQSEGDAAKLEMQAMLERLRVGQEAMGQMLDQHHQIQMADKQAAQASAQADKETAKEDKAEKGKEEPADNMHAELAAALAKLSESISKPKIRRVKSRDKNGNIQEVEEV